MKTGSLLPAALSIPAVMGQFTNPPLWNDLADLDILRIDDTYYYTASTMHYSPGAPVLRSYDLVNWEFVGHSVPQLDFSPENLYNLDGGHAYIKGIWASWLAYRPSNSLFYWGGCIDEGSTYVYTASEASGPWEQSGVINNCYYDAGMLVDEDDKLYVAYGRETISVAELSEDGFSEVQTQDVHTSDEYIEGSRFYKINGNYYIFVTRPADAQYILKSTDGPFGPYEMRSLVDQVPAPVEGAGSPHQGGIVDTPAGNWYYMAFIDAYPGGRVPVLAPMTWDEEGWPHMELIDGAWGQTYENPLPIVEVEPLTGVDDFSSGSLSHQWEWNHNPDNSKWSIGENGLTLQTVAVTDDLYAARNTLTRRIFGPSSTGTIVMDISSMQDGDFAGLVLLRHDSAWIGVKRESGAPRVAMVNELTMDENFDTATKGTEVENADIEGNEIHLRVAADIDPGSDYGAVFSYSTDGQNFSELGEQFTMDTNWEFFMGYRFGIFNYATTSIGGSVTVSQFDMAQP